MNMVAEGVKSSPSVLDLARRYGVEMPITEQVVAVCHNGRPRLGGAELADAADEQGRVRLSGAGFDNSSLGEPTSPA